MCLCLLSRDPKYHLDNELSSQLPGELISNNEMQINEKTRVCNESASLVQDSIDELNHKVKIKSNNYYLFLSKQILILFY